MVNNSSEIDMGFTKERIPDCTHICLIFDNEEQRQKIVAEYIAAGLKQGELVRYFADTTSTEDINSWLSAMGVEIPENGPFGVYKAETAYCPTGQFDPKAMIDKMIPTYDRAKQAGYNGVRSIGEMTWSLKGLPGSDRVLEYEALLNTIKTTYPHIGMCMYDANLFDGATLFKVLQVHPYMVAHGQIVRNPYYIRPEEFQN
ncbi:MAG: hypothetical protein C0410_07240 [Anaerolinea sp.]|nr:hypothetical protein [Anaerolinea sp.]